MKATLSMPGWLTSAAPMSPAPVMMLTTPGGRSASAMISASTRIDNGVVSAGLITTVFPAASAGAIFQAAISSGKFHGITWPATPSGAVRAETGVLQLVRPAGVVEEVRRRGGHVDVAGFLDRLAVVQGLHDGEFAGRSAMPRAMRNRYFPRSAPGIRRPDLVVGLPGRGDRVVDIGRAGRADRGQRLLGGRVDRS